jgi:hypothetical protein
MTSGGDLAACFARGLLSTFRSLKSEGAGMPGAQCARSRACRVENTRVSHHGHTGNTRHSPRNGFNGFLRALPGDRALLPPSPAKVAFRKLDASVGASGPHDFAVRVGAVRLRRVSVHRIQPRVRDDRDTPLCEVDGGSSNVDLPDVLSGIFSAAGLDSRATDLPVGQGGLNGRADLPPQIPQSSPGLTGRSSNPETAQWNRNAAAYWIPRMRGV